MERRADARAAALHDARRMTNTTATITAPDTVDRSPVLDEATLESFRDRAADFDEAGRFPHDDLADLRRIGWLTAAAPQRARRPRPRPRDARRRTTPPRPLRAGYRPVDVHAPLLGRPGRDPRCRSATRSASASSVGSADGEILASGHAEIGNDIPIALSTTRAERVPGGWRLHGRKLFGSLGPVWDRLGVHAMDATDPSRPSRSSTASSAADTPGVTVVDTWDAQGMRATESHDTVLDGAFVPDENVLCVVPAGPPTDPAVGAMTVWALTLIANVYVGIAERALDLAVEHARPPHLHRHPQQHLRPPSPGAAAGRGHAPRARRRPRRARPAGARLGRRASTTAPAGPCRSSRPSGEPPPPR